MPAAAVVGNLKLELGAGPAADQRPRFGAWRATWPALTRFITRAAVGRTAVIEHFVRRAAAKRLMRPVLVVPLDGQVDLAPHGAPRERNDRQLSQAFFQSADVALDYRDAAVLAQRSETRRPDSLVAAPPAEARIIELLAAVADEVLGRCAGLRNGPAQECTHGLG